jgi:exodeoxyribonuclease V alpha subunit
MAQASASGEKQKGMHSIDLVLTKLIFAAADGGFAIYATNQGYSAKTSFLGDKPESLVDSKISLTGHFEKYTNKQTKLQDDQFVFHEYEIQEEPLFFFLRKMVRGVSERAAREIIARYNDEEFERLVADKPEELLKIRGIGIKQLKTIQTDWVEYKKYLALGKELLPFGITPNVVKKIREFFVNSKTDEIIRILKDNPYCLTQIEGIGFKKADEIALKMGLDPESPVRIEACLLYCFAEKIMKKGHTVATTATLLKSMDDEIEVPDELKRTALVSLERKEEFSLVPGGAKVESIADDEAMIAPSFVLAQERFIMQASQKYGGVQKDQKRSAIVSDIEAYIANKNAEREAAGEKPYGEQQCKAIRLANTLPPIMAIIGYAGTGKTTTSKAVLGLYETMYGRGSIMACALAGVAANRTKISSGFNAVTVASLLIALPPGKKLPYRVILLDEAGMVGTQMMFSLLKAIDFENGAKLVMLGDTAQVQPVEAGDPLSDMLVNNFIPSVTLDIIYRNDEGSVINEFAGEVRKGLVPANYKGAYKDFSFASIELENRKSIKAKLSADDYKVVNDENLMKIQRHIMRTVQQRIPSINEAYGKGNYFDYLYDTQVLSPMKMGPVGVAALNLALQETFNPKVDNAIELKTPNGTIRVRDKVLHLKNKPMDVLEDGANDTQEIKVHNGQLGVVLAIKLDDSSVPDEAEVYFPNEKYTVTYTKAEIAQGLVDLGWCKTVHKSQGSEYQRVIAPIVVSHYNMLNPKLIYTLMTRAKKYLHLAGHDAAFISGCKNMGATNRLTCMSVMACDESARQVDVQIFEKDLKAGNSRHAIADGDIAVFDPNAYRREVEFMNTIDLHAGENQPAGEREFASGDYDDFQSFSDRREQNSPNFA